MYLERIEQNNTKLDEILVKVNELPESGGGAGGEGSMPPEFTYTGGYAIYHDTQGLWRLIMLTSGILTFKKNITIDAFLVGGGGGGGGGAANNLNDFSSGGGGGGGYVATHKGISLAANHEYSIAIGAGGNGGAAGSYTSSGGAATTGPASSGAQGGTTEAFTFTATGGMGGEGAENTLQNSIAQGGVGQSNGAAAKGGMGGNATAREFGDADGILFSAGGASISSVSPYNPTSINNALVSGGYGGTRYENYGYSNFSTGDGFVMWPHISRGARGVAASYSALRLSWHIFGGGSGYGGGGAGGFGTFSYGTPHAGGAGAAGAVVIRAAKEE